MTHLLTAITNQSTWTFILTHHKKIKVNRINFSNFDGLNSKFKNQNLGKFDRILFFKYCLKLYVSSMYRMGLATVFVYEMILMTALIR